MLHSGGNPTSVTISGPYAYRLIQVIKTFRFFIRLGSGKMPIQGSSRLAEQNGWRRSLKLLSMFFQPRPSSHHGWRLAGDLLATSSGPAESANVCKLTSRYALNTISHQRSIEVESVRRWS